MNSKHFSSLFYNSVKFKNTETIDTDVNISFIHITSCAVTYDQNMGNAFTNGKYVLKHKIRLLFILNMIKICKYYETAST